MSAAPDGYVEVEGRLGRPQPREELIIVAVLGLILLVAAGVLTAAVVTSNTGAIETDLWGATISNVSLGVVFAAGMLTTLVAVAALLLLTGAARRGRRLRQERRALRRENERLSHQVGTGVPADDGTASADDRRRPTDSGTDPAIDDSTRRIDDRSVPERDDDGTVDSTRSPADVAERRRPASDEYGSPRSRATSDAGG
jgi:uncharacterized membrane protein YidH (DUF202 family)